MRSQLPLPSQKRKYKLAGPSALVCPVLDVVCLLSEAQPPEQGCGWGIEGVSGSGNAASRKGGKQVVKQTLQRLGGITLSLSAMGKGDSNLKLSWLVRQAV